ncbi:MAG TPA: alpha/beta fold hydrolase [Kofleriaceae bacterium]|nr:alpha/beta fold hydrolase [Kofleriaceae bacterium]
MAQIVLVHGAWHGSWCWDDFAARLAGRGHGVRAAELRGHARPSGRIWHRIRDYVADLESAVADLAEPPILVGHSMGGFVVQKFLERGDAAGAVLMAPTPPWGVIRTTARIALRHPLAFLAANLRLRLRPLVATPALVRDLLFTAATPADIIERACARVWDESYRAYLDMLLFVRARPRRVRAPLLVLGGERDVVFTAAQVRRTARAYGTEAEIFDGLGHDLMLDAGWERVADRIDAWARDPRARPADQTRPTRRAGGAAGSP